MNITDANRSDVESRLLLASSDPRVATVLRQAGARLDGSDDLFVLCAVDDELARRFAPAEHPLYVSVSFRPRNVGRGSAPAPVPVVRFGHGPAPAGDAARILDACRDPLAELRWPGGGRAGVERIARGIPPDDPRAAEAFAAALAAVRVTPEVRPLLQRRGRRVAAFADEVAALEGLGRTLLRFAEAFAAATPPLFSPAPREPVSAAVEAILRTPGFAEETLRRWLVGEAERAVADPHRLRVRSREACAVTGVRPPFDRHGPSSLADALLAWRYRYGSPADLERLESAQAAVRMRLAGELVVAVESAFDALAAAEAAGAAVANAPTVRLRPAAEARRALAAALDLAFAGGLGVDGTFDRDAARRLVTTGAAHLDAVRAATARLLVFLR